jgi:hypothetical protein
MKRSSFAVGLAVGTATALIGWSSSGSWPVSSIAGNIEAHRDVAHGGGYGCVVTKSQISYIAACNAVSEAALHRRFGRDILKEAAK